MSSIFNKNYVNVTYKNKMTKYPYKFAKYIINKYNIPYGSKILDIGCGNGEITSHFEQLGMVVYGLDISDSAIGNLNNDSFKKYNLNNTNYPFGDNEFDFIFSKSVVEHLREPDILIDEAYRMLKHGGTFICMTPSWKHSYKEAFYIDHTHVTPFTKHSLTVACELSGFDSRTEYFYQLPLLWRFPILNLFRYVISKLPLPYKPFNDFPWGNETNKVIRFSKEAMLICKSIKK